MSLNYTPHQLRFAVAQLCPEVTSRWCANAAELDCEHALWNELACCLLSSQVSYAMAQVATQALADSGLLCSGGKDEDTLARAMERRLSKPLPMNGGLRRYRFPRSKARQLAASWCAVQRTFGSLAAFKCSVTDARRARAWLVTHAPGIGPKQASMYLRNAHGSVGLAVLDRHVVHYMDQVGIGVPRAAELSRLASYEQWEGALSAHAQRLGYAVGMLDVAVWVVMRVARAAETRPLS